MDYQKLPKFDETFMSTLKVLNQHNALSRSELRNIVQDTYYSNLSPDDLSRTTSGGQPLIQNRIGWGWAHLKAGGFIEQPERAIFVITKKGRQVITKGQLTLQDLKADPEYQAHKKQRNKTNSVEKIISNDIDESATPEDLIESGISLIESDVKSSLIARLKDMDPYYFERVILILLDKMGYGDVYDTKKSNDGGIYGIINQDKLGLDKIYIQAKRYGENKVREPDIRNFIGAMSGDTTRGIFVTTSAFDSKAIIKAESAHHKIVLIDGEKLVDLMHKYNVGVQTRTVYKVKQIDEDFFNA